MSEINLLPQEQRTAQNFGSLYKKLLFAAISLLLLTAVATIGILAIFSVLSARRSLLVTQVEQGTAAIDNFKPVEELQVVIKQKVTVVDKILTARTKLGETFQTLVQLVPQGVFFTDMRFSGTKVSISGRAKTSGNVAGFVSQLVSAKGAGILTNVSVDSLSSDDTGVYAFVLTAQLVK